MKKNIILTDDHAIMRKGLKELIEKLGPYKVMAEYGNGKELVDAYPYNPTPDLIVLDLSMPVMEGPEVVEWMKQKKVNIPILVLTLLDDEPLIISLFRKGIRGYLNKNCDYEQLRNALEQIFTNGYYHDEMMHKAMTFDQNLLQEKQEERNVKIMLNENQKKFLLLVCHEDEYTYEQIGSIMNVSKKTIDGYRSFFFETFDIKSKIGLVLFAMKNGLLD